MSETHVIKNNKILDWLFETVFFTFLPILFSIIICIMKNGSLNFGRLVGDGELVLASFSIIIPSIFKLYKKGTYSKGNKFKIVFYLLLSSSFLQIVVYTSIKTSSNKHLLAVYVASIFCVLSSIIFAWVGEKLIEKNK